MNSINLSRDLHEKLRCDSPFQHNRTLKRIQNYLVYYITYYKLNGAISQEENHGNFTLHITLSANGKTLTENNADELLKAIASLGKFDGFDLEVRYYGRIGDVECRFNDMEIDYPDVISNDEGMLKYLKEIENPKFEYVVTASCNRDGGVPMYCINDSSKPGVHIVNPYIGDTTDDCEMVDTGEFYLLIQFDFEKNSIQYENIKDIIVEYDSIEEELKYSREIWEKGNYVGFRNLAGGRHNVGKFVRMLEKINKELKSVEGDISSMREGALYSVDELKYAYISVDEEHQFSLVVFS